MNPTVLAAKQPRPGIKGTVDAVLVHILLRPGYLPRDQINVFEGFSCIFSRLMSHLHLSDFLNKPSLIVLRNTPPLPCKELMAEFCILHRKDLRNFSVQLTLPNAILFEKSDGCHEYQGRYTNSDLKF